MLPPRTQHAAAALLLAVASTHCNPSQATSSTATASAAPSRTFTHDAFGISFEIPIHWVERTRGDSVVLSGPPGSDAYYTTLTVQALPRNPGNLDTAVRNAYGPLDTETEVTWEALEPSVIDARPAVSYRMSFLWQETPRQRTGVLVDTGRLLVDVSYSANAAVFDTGLPAFLAAVDSLTVF